MFSGMSNPFKGLPNPFRTFSSEAFIDITVVPDSSEMRLRLIPFVNGMNMTYYCFMMPIDRKQKEDKLLCQPPVAKQLVFSRWGANINVLPLETPFKIIVYDNDYLQTWVSDRDPKSGRLTMIRQDDTVSANKCSKCGLTVYLEYCVYDRNDQILHLGCFSCHHCRNLIIIKPELDSKVDIVHDKDDKVYHRACYELIYPSPKGSLADCLADSTWILEWTKKPANDHAVSVTTTNNTNDSKDSISSVYVSREETQTCKSKQSEESKRRELRFRSDGKLSDDGIYQSNTWRVRDDHHDIKNSEDNSEDSEDSEANSVICQDIAGLGSYILTFDREYLHFTGSRVGQQALQAQQAQQAQQPSSAQESQEQTALDLKQTVTGYRLGHQPIDLKTPTGFDPIPLDRY